MSKPSKKRVTVSGFLSTVAIFLTSSLRGFPFQKITAEPWFLTYFTPNLFIRYAALVVFIAGVIGLCWAWYHLLQHAKASNVGVRSVWKIWFLWSLPIAFAAPLFSGDVFVYYVDGEAYLRGFNIYDHGVSAMGPDDLVHMVHPLWQDTQTMYGPVFMRLATAVAWIANANVVLGVALFKVLVFGSVVMLGIAAQRLARHFGRNEAETVAFAMVNPLVILHFVGGTHNDALMVGLLALGLAFGIVYRNWVMRFVGLFLIALASMMKLPAFAGLVMLGWIWAGERANVTWKARFGFAAITGAIGVVFVQLMTMATGLGWGWLNALDVPGLARPVFAPANALANALGGVFGVAHTVGDVVRIIAQLASVALSAYFILRLGKNATAQQIVRALGWSLLAVGWLSPSVYAWYLIWGIAIVAIAGAERMEKMLIGIIIVSCFVIYPSSGGVLDTGPRWLVIVFSYIVVLVMSAAIVRTLIINGITTHGIAHGIARPFKWTFRQLSRGGSTP